MAFQPHELTHFEILTEKLKAETYQSSDSREILSSLLENPKALLDPKDREKYGILQDYLQHEDSSIRRLAYIAISLAILSAGSSTGIWLSTNLWYAIISEPYPTLVLDGGGEELSSLKLFEWKAFWCAVKNSSLTGIDFGHNHLEKLADEIWEAFWYGLRNSMITSLQLTNNQLGRLPLHQWKRLCTGLKNSSLISLYMSCTFLDQLTPTQWEIFWNAINAGKITKLIIGGNFLFKMTKDHWQAFNAGIKASKLTTLDLSFNDFHKSEFKGSFLIEALQDNFNLALGNLNLSGLPEEPALASLNKRNEQIEEAKKTARDFLTTDEINEDEMNIALLKLSECLLLLENYSTTNSKTCCRELLTLKTNLLFEVFNRNYLNLLSHEIELTPQKRHSILLKEIPCWLDHKDSLVMLSEINKTVLNGVLLDACGIKNFGAAMTDNERHVLLKYTFLKMLLESQPKFAASPFFASSEGSPTMQLPTIKVVADILNLQTQIEALWQSVVDQSMDASLRELFSAIHALSGTIESSCAPNLFG